MHLLNYYDRFQSDYHIHHFSNAQEKEVSHILLVLNAAKR